MLSYLASVLSYFYPKTEDDGDEQREEYLAEQILDLEILNEDNNEGNSNPASNIPRSAECFQRTGIITFINEGETYILIDGMLYYDYSSCSLNFNINDKVIYLGYKDDNDAIKIVRILENTGPVWGDEEYHEENRFDVIEHVVVGEVDYRKDRFVYMKDSDLKFNLDEVVSTLVPTKGDWLELKCSVKWDESKPTDISDTQVLNVIAIKPLRSTVKNAVVTSNFGDSGICDRKILFDKRSLQLGVLPVVGSKVLVEAIESNQGMCTWRAIKLLTTDTVVTPIHNIEHDDVNLQFELNKSLKITHPLKFDLDFNDRQKINLDIVNNSENIYTINKWIILSKKRDSQIEVKPFLSHPIKLHPKDSYSLTLTCHPKFLGNARECLIIMFKGFQVKRYVEINIGNANSGYDNTTSDKYYNSLNENIKSLINIRKSNQNFVPGVRPVKPPAFISVKLGNYPIPQKIWDAVLGDSEQTIHSSEYSKILDRIETNLPCLSQDLNVYSYTDRWHTLVYMEEIQENINMRNHDKSKVFLIHCQEYLGLELQDLAEKRPSLIKGHKVLVKDTWDPNATQYEGYIHAIKGNLILMKFNQYFHERYSGSDVSVEFNFCRTLYRRSHQAINLALSNLGPDILFPSRLLSQTPQVIDDKLKAIEWYNKNLNTGQKTAIVNILKGECKPMPYCIYGPPGTGKTVTVIETILQVLTHLPESRILVATPSNSAANLITERLLNYRDKFPDSLVRLIANYLVDGDNIPAIIKPFCATLDIAKENSSRSKQGVVNGFNVNCKESFIGRHRVTIGTCYCLGSLAHLGLPKGHFTHVIVDEAGQATEPEIMIPLTFIDKENGQLILAGDPMQLGPVIMSKYCNEFGYYESYLSRLLETYPYQKDYDAFETGFNNKLVTRLNDNYRSLEEVINLSSELFYDGSLVAKIDRSQEWITNYLFVISEMFDSTDGNGGIFVYGIKGTNERAVDSPSWFNAQEASMVALLTCKMYKKNVNIDDIGIITPYIAQIKYLRLVFDAMGLPQPKIGTVEEFQGQERPIILITTVRSTQSYVQDDLKYSLGFVNSPKRLNVALTRSQVATIVFCNPHLLSIDRLWDSVIKYAVKRDKYMGCDLPAIYNAINGFNVPPTEHA